MTVVGSNCGAQVHVPLECTPLALIQLAIYVYIDDVMDDAGPITISFLLRYFEMEMGRNRIVCVALPDPLSIVLLDKPCCAKSSCNWL